jgi:hypothetical protein
MKLIEFVSMAKSFVLAIAMIGFAGQAAFGEGVCPCDGVVTPTGAFPGLPDILDLLAVNDCVAGDCSSCTLASCDIDCDGTVDTTDSAIEVCIIINGDIGGVSCCDQPTGSCVGHDTSVVPGLCFNGPQVTCEHPSVGGTYGGDGTVCTGQQLGIPATSEWGLVFLALTLLSAGSLLVRRRTHEARQLMMKV